MLLCEFLLRFASPFKSSHTPRLRAAGFDDLALRAAVEDPNFAAGTSAKGEEALGLNPYNYLCRFQESMNEADRSQGA